MKHKSGMADNPQVARHLMGTLIGIVVAITTLVSPLYATDLKDIRIGEYKDHTRVVFEFDQPIDQIDQEDRIVQFNNRLTAMFPGTDPDLVRKIPFEQSRRIKNLQIWIGKNNVSVALFFNFANYRYESFRIDDPFRIALDIYPLKGQKLDGAPSVPKSNQKPASNGQPSTIAADQVTSKTESRQVLQTRADSGSPIIPETDDQTTLSEAQNLKTPDTLPPLTSGSQISTDLPSSPSGQKDSTTTSPDPSNQEPQYATGMLQYYLIIALIILTLIILGLLTMMLLSKHKWADDNKPEQRKNMTEQQDDKIASLKATIQEQLKHDDET